MKDSDRIAISRESRGILANALMRVTVGLTDVDHGFTPATGTLVAIGERVFIATAAHVIPPHPNGRIHVVSGRDSRPADGMLAFIRHGRLEYADVGYLEVNGEVVAQFLGKSPCSLDQLADYGIGRARGSAYLLGVSSSQTSSDHVQRSGCLGFVGYACNALSVAEIEQKGPEPAFHSAVDVFLDYEFRDCRRLDTCERIEPPDPRGMSGGGIWDEGFDGGLWHPDKARLFAIQCAWNRRRCYLRGVQVIHWLKLVYHDYPDVRAILDERHAGISRSDPRRRT